MIHEGGNREPVNNDVLKSEVSERKIRKENIFRRHTTVRVLRNLIMIKMVKPEFPEIIQTQYQPTQKLVKKIFRAKIVTICIVTFYRNDVMILKV